MNNPIDDFTRSAGLYDFTSKAAIDYAEGQRRVVDEDDAIESLAALSDTLTMNDITREEFNAKLETIEVKMDARSESVSLKIDGFLAAQAERDKRLDSVLAQIGKDHSETKTSIGSMKTTLIVTALSTVIAIVLGVAGFNTALTSNMLSAFQAGKSDSSSATATNNTNASKPQAPTSNK